MKNLFGRNFAVLCTSLLSALLLIGCQQYSHTELTSKSTVQSTPVKSSTDHLSPKPLSTEQSSFNAMAPLLLTNDAQWQAFESDLQTAKNMGLDGISVDIWWGLVEGKGDQQFDWRYYHKMVNLLAKYQLQWIPIMSFHQCGGNVGDTCDIPIPSWIWTHFEGVAADDLKFKSEQGNYASETLSIWQSPAVLAEILKQYQQFMEAFEAEFAHKKNMIQELNISMGSAGELRYPSYNGHDLGTDYPTRGGIQGFSQQAIASFVDYLLVKYQTSENVVKTLQLPDVPLMQQIAALDFESVFNQGRHLKAGLAQEYLTWYHQSLIAHSKRMLSAGDSGFDGVFKEIPLGYKIPGIHWKIAAPKGLTRSAELAAGLIAPMDYKRENAWGYKAMLSIAKDFELASGRQVIVHFTALEMSNQPSAPAYSRAKTLVNWMAQGAEDLGVNIKGENALAAGVYSEQGWDNIESALATHYSGLTVLRVTDIANIERNALGLERYRKLIEKAKKSN